MGQGPRTAVGPLGTVSGRLGVSAATTSEIATRPPGLRTRAISAMTGDLSGARLITQFEITTSTAASGNGTSSIMPSRNSTS